MPDRAENSRSVKDIFATRKRLEGRVRKIVRQAMAPVEARRVECLPRFVAGILREPALVDEPDMDLWAVDNRPDQ